MTTYSPATLRAIKKATVRLLPLMGLLYFFNYLDRVNVGYAALRMNEDLGLSSAAYGLGAGLFFIGYFIFEVPSNLMLHKVGARVWIARIAITWGILATCMAFVNSSETFYLVRFLTGIAEAGLFPGLILFLTYWFPRARRAKITAMFILAIPLSSVFGAPVSSLLLQHGGGWLGFEQSWRVMFFLEGIPPIIIGICTLFLLPNRPRDAKWLTAEEKSELTQVIDAEDAQQVQGRGHMPLKRALTSSRVVGLAITYFGITYGLYAMSFFLPQIISGFQESFGSKLSLLQIGLVTAIPFGIGAVAMLLNAWHSDKTSERRFHTAIPVVVGAVGIAVAMNLGSPSTTVVAISVGAAGIFAALAVFWQLPSAFLTGTAAAGGIAMINSFGNLSGFVGPYLTGWLHDLTGNYKAGMFLVAGFMLLSAAIVYKLGRTRDDEGLQNASPDLAPRVHQAT
ncbi:MFS transporter [Rhodococcoides trifolii]|uniref:Putative tartrate transporter n=1 Tax=Rhodococcoides trifolii TaxID=908250 RepID=A0A917G016_9NOCA|nr:MFS transporter [Rhodococcus trifolii]